MTGPMLGLSEHALRDVTLMHTSGAPAALDLVVGVATRVEGYVDTVLHRLIERTDYRRQPFLAAMYADLELSIFQSWRDRFRWLANGFGISIAGTAEAQQLQVLIELRNAVVHGGGRLTERQTRDVNELITLEHSARRVFHVDVDRSRLIPSEKTRDATVSVGREFVIAFDTEVRARTGLRDL